MGDTRPIEGQKDPKASTEPDPRFMVFGLFIVVRILREPPLDRVLYCPQDHPIRYGEVLGRGDGFDPHAEFFRRMPPLGSLIAFEEPPEGVEGHYFYIGEEEYRILHMDAINIAFPPER